MVTAKKFAPSHITGFFQIFDESENPLQKGSKGAGLSIKNGVWTQVIAKESKEESVKVWINEHLVPNPVVSLEVIRIFKERFPKLRKFSIEVRHDVGMASGAGFGTSGAGALSLALALNSAFKLGLRKLDVAQIAHVAEVRCKTGLGTVLAETFGGIEVRVKPGAPGIGRVVQIPVVDNLKVVCIYFGALPTDKYLANEDIRRLVNSFGGKLLDELLIDPSVEKMMELSRKFAEFIGLATPRVKRILEELDKLGLTGSVPVFGEGVFVLAESDRVFDVVEVFRKFGDEGRIAITEIDFDGIRRSYED